MAFPRRYVIVASSILLILIIAISLATSIEIRAAPAKLIQISTAQAAKIGQFDADIARKAGAEINGTDFDRADIVNGTTTVGVQEHGSTLFISGTSTSLATATKSEDAEGMIGTAPTVRPTTTQSQDEGFIGEKTTATPTPTPTPTPTAIPRPPPPPPVPQLPILALSYAGSGGPKHCRGELVQKLEIPQPASDWKNGTCVDLPSQARCGVFFSGKDAGCEAQLFNMAGCVNTTRTYVNTVVFMPEERTVGALWTSMYIKCGVEAPDAGLIDPAILGGLLKPKPGAGG
ncbi:hypothetical protein P280DRAFT_500001 [Massarina eburnea CBS 473.64]|uniref:Uncharacterized protein n=1 Tax=Massarina eburnea CBS 473.64 TaxID=1395130 RepID=A0A6A6RXR4_9PLEO|nr:hypothetical protein P280DRAFT_500001 [Massarina eburnea CBS 473.64]